MTIRELMAATGQNSEWMLLAIAAPPLLSLVLGFLHPRGAGARKPFGYLYALVLYAACVPGVGAALLDAYMLAFTRENLLDTNPLVTIAPIVGMVTTLGVVQRRVSFYDLPGVDRLSGLVLMLTVAFVGMLMLTKMHFVSVFHGSFVGLLGFAVAVFVAFRLGAHLLFRRKRTRWD